MERFPPGSTQPPSPDSEFSPLLLTELTVRWAEKYNPEWWAASWSAAKASTHRSWVWEVPWSELLERSGGPLGVREPGGERKGLLDLRTSVEQEAGRGEHGYGLGSAGGSGRPMRKAPCGAGNGLVMPWSLDLIFGAWGAIDEF